MRGTRLSQAQELPATNNTGLSQAQELPATNNTGLSQPKHASGPRPGPEARQPRGARRALNGESPSYQSVSSAA